MRFHRFRVVVGLAVVFSLSGCTKQQGSRLTRDEAANKIHAGLPPKTECTVTQNGSRTGIPPNPLISVLIQEGYMTSYRRLADVNGVTWDMTDYIFTSKVSRSANFNTMGVFDLPMTYTVTVTGIMEEPSGSSATIEYQAVPTLGIVNGSANLTKALLDSNSCHLPNSGASPLTVVNGRVLFSKYDDGWRIMK